MNISSKYYNHTEINVSDHSNASDKYNFVALFFVLVLIVGLAWV